MNPTVRSSLIAGAIAFFIAIVAGLVFGMGGDTVVFAIAMAAIGFVGTFVITSIIVASRK